MESYQLSLAPAKCQQPTTICHPDADKDSNQYYIGNKNFPVCLQCVIWVLSFPVTINGANMFVALFLKLLFVHNKFYIVSVPTMFGFCSKHILLTSDHCLNINTETWSPFLKSGISMAEFCFHCNISYLRKFCFHCNISYTLYSHRLNMLNLKLLKYRRVEFDLMFMYKIIHGYVNLNFSDFFSVCHGKYNLHTHSFTIKPLRRSYTEHLNNFFTHRAS